MRRVMKLEEQQHTATLEYRRLALQLKDRERGLQQVLKTFLSLQSKSLSLISRKRKVPPLGSSCALHPPWVAVAMAFRLT